MAYSLSKMSVKNEAANAARYRELTLVEFFEFLGRWGYYLFDDKKLTYQQRFKQILSLLLPAVGMTCRFRDIQPKVEYLSDCDDDTVDEIIHSIKNNN